MGEHEVDECVKICRNANHVFVAYNANIDYIKHVDKSLEKIAATFNSDAIYRKKISSPPDLFSNLKHSIKHNEGFEIGVDEKIEKWLQKNLDPEEKKMGGQAGIMSNHLSLLGINPIVYTPLLSDEQKKFFKKNVVFVDNGIKKWNEVKRNDKKKVNWIFEYNRGDKFLGLKAKGSNRFIVSTRLEKFRMGNVQLNFDFNAAMLAGFHSIKKRYADGTTYKQQFAVARNVFQKIREKKKPIHLEFAYSPDDAVNKEMLELARLSDSVGMDEQDLMNALRVIGKRGLSKKIHEKYDVKDIFKGVEILSDKFEIKKIHLHGSGYFLALCKKDYHLSPDKVREAMRFASVVAASYAKYNVKSRKDFRKGVSIPISSIGKKKERRIAKMIHATKKEISDGIFRRRDYDAVVVPTRMARRVKDIVGLGDIISSTIFAYEVGFLPERKES